ncbi:hypothetical protein QVD17_27227 [Tagetes erecta]|uniref:EF-hand domain-containing protein n=1 Tax=Tagetes erecta TaxID=13708 RepID=A0AAD8KAJ2_TARER|nr:hypothetical protein QVD17_27227 [Tagetes erecta]
MKKKRLRTDNDETTGLSSSKEKAQQYVVTGAGLLAGSSILLLTLLWGVCFICARKKFYVESDSNLEENQARQLLIGSGVFTDVETRFHAKIMLFSLIPFVIILLPSVFGLSYSSHEYSIVLLVSLFASIICMISYFCYQSYNRQIWERRLEYAEVEQKVEMHVPFYEVQALMLDREKHLMKKQKEMENEFNAPGTNKETMSKEEFYVEFDKWLHVTRDLMDDPYSLDKTGETEYNEVVKLLLEEKNKLIKLMSDMIKLAAPQNLLKEDGTQDDLAIYKFFKKIDADHDESITRSELEKFIMKVNYDEILVDDEIVEIMMRHLDIDGNGGINVHEFKSGVEKLLASSNLQKRPDDKKKENDKYHLTEAKAKAEEMFKAIILLIVGIVMLTVLAEPLVESVRQFSESARIEPFYVSFILVPLATNARTAIAAIRAANQKRHHTTSLTFSEIYHKVFLNNIMGLSVLVSVIYFRGLIWHFSAEVLTLVVICVIIGLLASLKSKFPNWTLLVAFPLYPLSMVIVYFVNDTFQFT